jgi:hypothetical protein
MILVNYNRADTTAQIDFVGVRKERPIGDGIRMVKDPHFLNPAGWAQTIDINAVSYINSQLANSGHLPASLWNTVEGDYNCIELTEHGSAGANVIYEIPDKSFHPVIPNSFIVTNKFRLFPASHTSVNQYFIPCICLWSGSGTLVKIISAGGTVFQNSGDFTVLQWNTLATARPNGRGQGGDPGPGRLIGTMGFQWVNVANPNHSMFLSHLDGFLNVGSAG